MRRRASYVVPPYQKFHAGAHEESILRHDIINPKYTKQYNPLAAHASLATNANLSSIRSSQKFNVLDYVLPSLRESIDDPRVEAIAMEKVFNRTSPSRCNGKSTIHIR